MAIAEALSAPPRRLDGNQQTTSGQVAALEWFRQRRTQDHREIDWSSLSGRYQELALRLDQDSAILWIHQRHRGERPCFSPALLSEVLDLQNTLRAAFDGVAADQLPFRCLVWASELPEIYNLGGDLRRFVELIRARDGDALRGYAKACVDICYLNAINLDLPVLTAALVQGDALGGGFEAVLSNDLIVAEAGAQFGLPEVLFNMFPGMGAYSFLCRRLDGVRARQLILSGKLYGAEELRDMGLVDLVVPNGEGEAALHDHLARHNQRHGVLGAMARVARRCQPVDYQELIDVTEIWVETALRLGESDLRRMERLAAAQERRVKRLQTPAAGALSAAS